ncbi:MAG: MBL fold metallo-hydrolase [Promethearchaeota archaeon]|jgi:ribonuclease Z
MKITFLGTAGGLLTEKRGYPSILIDQSILLDCGDGTAQRLMQVNSIASIKTICLSHLHGDHYMGISSLLWYFMLTNRKEELTIIGPSPVKETTEKIFELLTIPGIIELLPFKLHFKELTDVNEVVKGQDGYTINYAEMEHTAQAFAYRIEKNGKSVCYSGDTKPNQNLIELANKCNVFICDSTFSDDQVELAYKHGHSTPFDAAKIARDVGCGKLVLFHFSPRFAKVVKQSIVGLKNIFDKEIVIADDLMSIVIK